MFHAHRFGFGLGHGRLFHKGDFKYLILDLLKDKPSYGYEIIRALEERFHGFYSPSPGIVYPTLQMLEEMGFVTSSLQDGKKVYAITDAGKQALSERKQAGEEIKSQIENLWDPELHRKFRETMGELWDLGRLAAYQGRRAGPEKLDRIREVISRAHKDIEAILGQTEKPGT
jgi:DNA-binding PadR family transcriptional regulator